MVLSGGVGFDVEWAKSLKSAEKLKRKLEKQKPNLEFKIFPLTQFTAHKVFIKDEYFMGKTFKNANLENLLSKRKLKEIIE